MPSPRQRQRQRDREALEQARKAREMVQARMQRGGVENLIITGGINDSAQPAPVSLADYINGRLSGQLRGSYDLMIDKDGSVVVSEEKGLYQQRQPEPWLAEPGPATDPVEDLRKANELFEQKTGRKADTVILHTQEGGGQPVGHQQPGGWLGGGASNGASRKLQPAGDSYTMQQNPVTEAIRSLVERVDKLEIDNQKLKRRVLRLEGEKKVGPTARKRTSTEGTE